MATRPICPLPPARCTLLRGVMLPVSGADGDGYVRRDVLLDGGVIAKIEPAGSLPAAPGAELLDCAERLLLPGFVNGHTHSVEHWARGLIKPLPLELWAGLVPNQGGPGGRLAPFPSRFITTSP